MKQKILITDSNYQHTLGICRDLFSKGYEIHVVGPSLSIASVSRSIARFISYPRGEKCLSIDFLLGILSDNSYDLLIPIGAHSVSLCSSYRSQIRQLTDIHLAPHDSLTLAFDKNKTLDHCFKIGISIPSSFIPLNKSELLGSIDLFNPPYVVKSNDENSKISVEYFLDKKSLFNFFNIHDYLYGKLVVQQMIVGTGLGFFAIYENGVCKNYFMHKRLREIPRTGGSSTCAISIHDDDLLLQGKSILDSLQWHGVAMVEFKRCKATHKLYLMEINPKFWGSHDLAIASGINFAEQYIQLSSASSIKTQKYNHPLRFQWPLPDLQACSLELSSFPAVLRDLFDIRVKNNFIISDPFPHFLQIAQFIYSLTLSIPLFKSILVFIYRASHFGIIAAIIKPFSEITGIPILKYCSISPLISVGAQQSAFGRKLLIRTNHRAVLSLRSDYDDQEYGLQLAHYLNIPIPEYTAPTISQLHQGVDFINTCISNNTRIYIHCREGVSRAPLFVVAYYLKYQLLSLEEALDLIRKTRPFIQILDNQYSVLNHFLESLSI